MCVDMAARQDTCVCLYGHCHELQQIPKCMCITLAPLDLNKQLCSTWNIALNRAECAVKTILWGCNLVSPALTTISDDDGSSKYGAKSETLSCTGCCFLLPCKHCLYVRTKAQISVCLSSQPEALTGTDVHTYNYLLVLQKTFMCMKETV